MEANRRVIRQTLRGLRKFSDYDFVEIVRNFEQAYALSPGVGYSKNFSRNIRFSQKPSLTGTLPDVTSIAEDKDGNAVIEVSRPGLLGTDGPMPLEFTSKVLQLSRNNYDYALQRFIDIINDQYVSLFYRAFAQNDFAIGYDKKDNNLPRAVMNALSGGSALEKSLPKFASEAMMPYMISKSFPKEGLRFVLKSFFGVEIKIRSNVFERYVIPRHLRCRLGDKETCTLGMSAQIGKHFYSHTKKFHLILGPMDFEDCQKILPGTRNFSFLTQIVNFYLQKPLEYDLIFILRKNSLKGVFLDGKSALGISSFFKYQDANGTCQLTINVSRLNVRRTDDI